MKNKFDWNEIQLTYDEGLSFNDLKEKFGIKSNTAFQKAKKRGDFIPRTGKETKRLKRTKEVSPGHKKCHKCKKIKLLNKFNKKEKNRLQAYCQSCNKEYISQYYQKNKKSLFKKIYSKKIERIWENKKLIFKLLSKEKCIDCGISDPLVLEFDHVKGNKKDAVGYLLISGYGWATIQKEIDKCHIRCANCHKKKTHIESRSYRAILANFI